MMKHEFEELIGRTVTAEQYQAFETIYMSSNQTKQEFAKTAMKMLEAIPETGKSEETIAREAEINKEIESLTECIEWSRTKMESYEANLKGNPEEDEFWISTINQEKELIRFITNRIDSLRWVLN